MNIHIAIKKLREEKGISQEKLAALAGLDRSFISMIERELRIPSLASIDKIAKALGVQTWEILKSIQDKKCQ